MQKCVINWKNINTKVKLNKSVTYRSCSKVSFVMAVGMCVSKLSSNSLQPKKHKVLDYYGQHNKYTLDVVAAVEAL
jgi:hypothetical protein